MLITTEKNRLGGKPEAGTGFGYWLTPRIILSAIYYTAEATAVVKRLEKQPLLKAA
jgi:hypothetical protein